MIIRPATPDDLNFIRTSWIEDYRNSPFARHMTAEAYYSIQQPVIAKILEMADVNIATINEDPEFIQGFIVHGKSIDGFTLVHYLYIRELLRKQGIGRALLESIKRTTPTICTHINNPYYGTRSKYDLISLRDHGTLCKMNAKEPMSAYPRWKMTQTKGNKDDK